jgi:biotin synthase
MNFRYLIDKLSKEKKLSHDEYMFLLSNRNDAREYLSYKARKIAKEKFENKIFIRGIIEFTNFCKNNCYYCGIRRDNFNIKRYRLTKEQIISCCQNGYKLGFRTFVLQGGEDLGFNNNYLANIIFEIKNKFPDCAITLSIGEKNYDTYKLLFDSGAERYLLRHETANNTHYKKLHPSSMSLYNRKKCLYDLKKIGYQIGTGFMVGSPFQTLENIIQDLNFIEKISPHMIGIGPFISHKDTKFHSQPNGTSELTTFLIGILRLAHPDALIPATTALATINNFGREEGILFGANVIMPNLSPNYVKGQYLLYDNKICINENINTCINCLTTRLDKIGYKIIIDRGDHKDFKHNLLNANH